ncbi:transposase [Kitasatospora sp. NPDC058218]|uniref:transposase n=1 Tax=Kitasatospora sp. NPDC058218 TaxID=3346385 RepID=UPI0036DB9A4F
MARERGGGGQVLDLEPAHRHPHQDLVRLAKSHWRVEHDYRELKTRLGLDHYEGRSYNGWHCHVTLFSVVHPVLTEQRSAPEARPGPDLPADPGPPPTRHRHLGRPLPHMPTTHPMADLRRHGGCSTRRALAPRRSWTSTSRTWTWPVAAGR